MLEDGSVRLVAIGENKEENFKYAKYEITGLTPDRVERLLNSNEQLLEERNTQVIEEGGKLYALEKWEQDKLEINGYSSLTPHFEGGKMPSRPTRDLVMAYLDFLTLEDDLNLSLEYCAKTPEEQLEHMEGVLKTLKETEDKYKPTPNEDEEEGPQFDFVVPVEDLPMEISFKKEDGPIRLEFHGNVTKITTLKEETRRLVCHGVVEADNPIGDISHL